MKKLSLLAVLSLLLGMPGKVFSQFQVDYIKETFAFEQPKMFTIYSDARYNRIEGPHPNIGLKFRPQQVSGLTLFGDAGYGFSNEDGKFRYHIGAQKDLFVPNRLSFGATYFDEVYSPDRWRLGFVENSVFAFFAHVDYMDYIGRQGAKGFVDYKLAHIHNVRLEVAGYKYETLSDTANIDWSVFGRNREFAPNPHAAPGFAFAPGNEISLRLIATLDYRDNPVFPLLGWFFEGIYERTFDDFETDGIFLTAKRFQPTFGNQKLKAKVLFGTRSGSFAYQHLIGLGGIGTLRGYESKEFTGNRMLFASAQYNFGGDILQKIPLQRLIPFWDSVSMGLFADAGYAWIADSSNAKAGLLDFGDFTLGDLKSDVGVSLIFTEGLLRFDFARRLDRSGDSWRFYVRILEKF